MSTHAFRPAMANDFRKRCPQFSKGLDWGGGRLWNLINSELAFDQLAISSQDGLPAISGIANFLAPILVAVDDKAERDALKRAIGSMICEVLQANEYRKSGQIRVRHPIARQMFFRAAVFTQDLSS